MASPAGPIIYWCHQCNVQTQPRLSEDVACTFCNQGFIEELDSTEVEPGVAFSTLPLAFGNFLRRPSPSSVGITRDRPTTDSPSQQQSSPFSSSSSSSSLIATTLQEPQQQTSPGEQQTDTQGHRPRILSGQLSGVPSLLEAMMQVIEEMNGPSPLSSRSASGNFDDASEHGGTISHGDDASLHARQDGSRDSGDDLGHRGETRSQILSASQEVGHAFVLPAPAPMLILHGSMPNGFHTVEVFVDNGQGMGPQMMPNHFRDYFMGPDLDRLIQMLAENDPNRYGTPPAAKSEVEKLPKFKITKEHLGSDIFQCAVCKDDFELDAEVQQMPCKHIYHPDCILPWLAVHNSCPVCRFELPTDDADYEARKGQSGSAQTNANPNPNPTEGQSMRMRTSSNLSEGQRGEAHVSINEELPDGESQDSRQFTLWGMPAVGFDMTMLSMLGSNPFMRREERSDSGRQAEMAQAQGAPRSEDGIRDGTPVQWLFRLFSSGSMSAQETTSTGGQSPGPGSGRNPSNR